MKRKVKEMTQNRSLNEAPLRFLAMALALVASIGGALSQTNPLDVVEVPEEDILLKEKWRHVGLHLFSDVPLSLIHI